MSFNDVSVKESPGLCRCCLSEGCYKDLGTEYTWMNENEVYADMLLDCFDIGITQHSDGPNGAKRLICEVCITRLRDACNFKKQVLDSEKKFVDMLGRGEFAPKVVLFPHPMKSETVEEMTIEDVDSTEVEYLDDIDYVPDEEVKEEEEITAPSSSKKRGRPKKEITNQSLKKQKVKEKTVKVNKDTATPTMRTATKLRRNNLKILFNTTTIVPFKWRNKFICFYCGDSFDDYNTLRKHTIGHGPCNTLCYSMMRIKGNVELKIDVSQISCTLCDTKFKSLEVIIEHLIQSHQLNYRKDIDMTCLQSFQVSDNICLKCGVIFDSFKSLIVHYNMDHSLVSFVCNFCGEKFNSKISIAKHLALSHTAEHSCKVCAREFKTRSELKEHFSASHLIRCHVCGKLFRSESILRHHMQVGHPDDGNRKCKHCHKDFHSAIGLKMHLSRCRMNSNLPAYTEDMPSQIEEGYDERIGKIHRSDIVRRDKAELHRMRKNIACVLNMSTAVPFKFKRNKYCCFYCLDYKHDEFDLVAQHSWTEHPICDIKMPCFKTLKGERIRTRIEVSRLTCKTCNIPMADLESFIDHAIENHGADFDKDVELSKCFDPFRISKDNVACPKCPESFPFYSTLLKHINAQHESQSVICDYCGQGFKSYSILSVHLKANHLGWCQCHICKIRLKNSEQLTRHMAKEHEIKAYKCDICDETFKSRYQKGIHMIKEHDTGVKCDMCNRLFTKYSFMRSHVRRIHLKERTVPCSVCNEKFFDTHQMRHHMVKHGGERKFRCEICGKAFLRSKNLKSHMDTHKKFGYLQ